MLYETFLQAVKDSILEQVGDGHTIIIRNVPKNNGVVLDGLCISKEGEKIAPTIYLNSYYEQYESGMSIDDILEDILALYYENLRLPGIDFSQLVLYPQLKNKIVYKLIHAESNQQLLSDIPYIPYMDLAVVFYLFLDENETGQMTALIHKEHQTMWNVSTEELYQLAKENTPRLLPPIIKNMVDVMKELAKENLGDDYRDEFLDELITVDDGQTPLYIMTNESGFNGACCILYDIPLKCFAEQLDKDLVILPSSIHEVLLIPNENSLSYDELGEMVTSINQSEVPREDQLSNQVYFYSKTDDQLSIISNPSAQSEQ